MSTVSSLMIVATQSMRNALRTGSGIISLFLMMMIGLSVAAPFVKPFEEPESGAIDSVSTEERLERYAESNLVRGPFEWITGADSEQTEYLLDVQPALISVILVFLLMFFPFIAGAAAFNQTSADIGSRGLRYLLLRTTRSNVLLGRFLGVVCFGTLGTLLLMTVLLFYIGIRLGVYPSGELIAWGFQGFLALFLVMLPHMAFCAFVSSKVDSAFGSLSLCSMLIGLPILFLWLAIDQLEYIDDLAWLWRIIPWGWKFELLDHDPMIRLRAYGAMLGFTVIFLWLGLRSFKKRDL